MKNYFVKELRKDMKPEDTAIEFIWGCYVNQDKEKIATYKERLSNLKDEDQHKYLSILKGGLSGTVTRSLQNLTFINGSENEMAGKMKDAARNENREAAIEYIFDHIIEKYPYGNNYLIIVANATHAVEKKLSDGTVMESDEVFPYILTAVCPVSRSKPGLSYVADNSNFSSRVLDWVVSNPDFAFLYPNRNKKETELASLLMYRKTGFSFTDEVIAEVLTCEPIDIRNKSREAFDDLVTAAVTAGVSDDIHEESIINNIQTQIEDLRKRNKAKPDEPITKDSFIELLKASGVTEAGIEAVEKKYETYEGRDPYMPLSAIEPKKTTSIRSENISILIKEEGKRLLRIDTINGEKCFVIKAESGVTVNGVKLVPDAVYDPDEDGFDEFTNQFQKEAKKDEADIPESDEDGNSESQPEEADNE